MTSPDVASQYVPTMNCIFAAQKHVGWPFPRRTLETLISSCRK